MTNRVSRQALIIGWGGARVALGTQKPFSAENAFCAFSATSASSPADNIYVPDGKLYKCDCTDIISDIYETLLKDGVPPEDIAMCRGENNCVAGNREVIGYLYEHLDKYEGLLVGRTPFIAPWSLSDHDPKTPFDELARAKAKALIERAVQGTAKELNEADRRLAEVKGIYEESLNDPFFFKEMSPTMPKEGEDPKFAKLGCPGKEFVKEESALEFLETKS
jgi:hypothetical protein